MPGQDTAEPISIARLDGFRVLIIAGPDRVQFLQGQLTQDVNLLETAGTALASWASAKGRLLASGQLIANGDEIWWPLPTDIIAGVARRLQMFVLRANVKIVISAMPVSGLFGVGAQDHLPFAGQNVAIENQPNHLADDSIVVRVVGDSNRAWLVGPSAEAGDHGSAMQTTAESTWVRESIRIGQPFIVADTQEMFVPQMLNLDRIGAISFEKGCYVGQEIVARTQNLGRIKRRMYRYSANQPTGLQPGATIYGPENITGKIVLSCEHSPSDELLAVVPIDAATEAWFADEEKHIRLVNQPLPYRVSD